MKPRTQRLWYLFAGGLVIAGFLVISLFALRDQILYFMTPSDIFEGDNYQKNISRNLSLGGVVCDNSISHDELTHTYTFEVTDNRKTIKVMYVGITPDLFKEGQAVVIHGALQQDGIFKAKRILAKHDENYMPREVAKKMNVVGNSSKIKPKDECFKSTQENAA